MRRILYCVPPQRQEKVPIFYKYMLLLFFKCKILSEIILEQKIQKKRSKVENQNILNIRTVGALTRAEGPNAKKTQIICNLWYYGRINVTLGQIKIK